MSKNLGAEIAALRSGDEVARERACRALLARAEAGENIASTVPELTRVLELGSVLTWIAACHALRAAAVRGAKITGAFRAAVRLVEKPPKISDGTLVLELRNAAVGVSVHQWLQGSNTWGISTTLKDRPELRVGVLIALREIAEANGKLAGPVLPEVAKLLAAKPAAVVEEAARVLRAHAAASAKQKKAVVKAVSGVKGAAAKALLEELGG